MWVRVLLLCAVAVGAVSLGAAWAAPDQTVPAVERVDLTVDGYTIAVFRRCLVSSETPDVLTGSAVQRVTCKRGLTADLALWSWREAAVASPPTAAKDATLIMYASDGAAAARWYLSDAYPVGLTASFDKAGVGREVVTLTASSLQRVAA